MWNKKGDNKLVVLAISGNKSPTSVAPCLIKNNINNKVKRRGNKYNQSNKSISKYVDEKKKIKPISLVTTSSLLAGPRNKNIILFQC